MEPLAKIDKIIDGLEKAVKDGADDASRNLIKGLSAWFDKLPMKDGKAVRSKELDRMLASLDSEMNRLIRTSTYPSAVADVARSYTDIQKYSLEVLGNVNPAMDVNAEATRLGINAIREQAVETITERLTTADITVQIKEPIRQAIIRNIQGGAPVSQVRSFLVKTLERPENAELAPFARYASQITLDGVLGWDGQIYDRFRSEYEVTEIRYIGSLIQDSRPQCIRWVRTMNGVIPIEKLQSEILWAQNSGSGMKKFTTPSTFCADRGGFHCRHKAIPVFV